MVSDLIKMTGGHLPPGLALVDGDIPLYAYLKRRGGGRLRQASGALIHIERALEQPVQSLVLDIVPHQETGDPSPSNILALSRKTGIHLYVSPTPDIADATVYELSWEDEAGLLWGCVVDALTGALSTDFTSESFGSNAGFSATTSRVWFHSLSRINEDRRDRSRCNMAKYQQTNSYGAFFSVQHGGTVDYFNLNKLTESETLADLDARLQANALQIVYPLETPTTYTITPIAPVLLEGENYIWADDATITMSYLSKV